MVSKGTNDRERNDLGLYSRRQYKRLFRYKTRLRLSLEDDARRFVFSDGRVEKTLLIHPVDLLVNN